MAGQRYYIEALQAEGGGGDHCSVGVQLPNGAYDRPISAEWLEPWSDKTVMLAIFAGSDEATESGIRGEFIIRRTGNNASPLSVSLAIAGTASNGGDYTAIATTHNFAAGSSEVRIPVQPLPDATLEGPETVVLTIQPNAAYDLGFSDSATVTIAGEPPPANLTAIDANASEGPTNTAVVRFQLGSAVFGPVTFKYSIGGSASNGTDFATLPGTVTLAAGQTITNLTITALADAQVEGTETVVISLVPGAGYLAGSASNATVTIADTTPANQPPVLAAISNQAVTAGRTLVITNVASDSNQPPQTLTFSLLSPPQGASIGPASGIFNWRPGISQVSTGTAISVKVEDDGTPIGSATQSFWVSVLSPAFPSLSQPRWNSNGLSLRINGDQGPDYLVQGSTNLSAWTTLLTTNPAVLPLDWVDLDSTNIPVRYYRLQLGPP